MMKKQNNLIYLDNSATTQVSKEVYDAMKPYYIEKYFNPDSSYYQAREVKAEIEKVRTMIAEEIGADPDEIYFTSGGSESNTWAMKIFHDKGVKEILTTPIEHHSLLNAIHEYIGEPLYALLETDAMSSVSNGRIDSDELSYILKRIDIQAASIIHANNEIGTIQSLPLIAGICEEYNIPLHTDAVQSFMKVPIDVDTMGVSMLSASAHKIGGPKGVGFLYIRHGFNEGIRPLICGGQQERSVRGGTTNVPGIIGFGKAIEIYRKKNKLLLKQNQIGDIIELALLNANGLDVMFTGSVAYRLPNHISMCFRDIDSTKLVSLLAEKGILCSAGSACSSESLEPSHVLEAINIPKQFINGAIRISCSDITKDQATYVAQAIEDSVKLLRGAV